MKMEESSQMVEDTVGNEEIAFKILQLTILSLMKMEESSQTVEDTVGNEEIAFNKCFHLTINHLNVVNSRH